MKKYLKKDKRCFNEILTLQSAFRKRNTSAKGC